MIIAVGDTRVYKFPQSTIECRVHNGHIEVVVMPERRRFTVRPHPDKMKRLQEAYPDKTYQYIATTLIINSLQSGFIQADEEVI